MEAGIRTAHATNCWCTGFIGILDFEVKASERTSAHESRLMQIGSVEVVGAPAAATSVLPKTDRVPVLLHRRGFFSCISAAASTPVSVNFSRSRSNNKRKTKKHIRYQKNLTTTAPSVIEIMDNRNVPNGLESSTNATNISSLYAEAIDAISTLISSTGPVKVGRSEYERQFAMMHEYIKILEMEDSLSKLKVIHVAGTKGKGSTCTFIESILRSSGFRTGLFTSPHLLDLCERFRLDGLEISQEKFVSYFWSCWNRLKANCTKDVPMPKFFRFATLLAFKIFIEEKVDVAIMEVGLGGRFDATNVVKTPSVCGISSLGYDHMEILGNTLREIASEKAGILKDGVPAITVTQPEEAMRAIEERAAELSIPLQVAPPLEASTLGGLKLGLDGDHQYINAGLAVELCRTWLRRTGHYEDVFEEKNIENGGCLPKPFIAGLTTAAFPGRSQIFHYPLQSSDHEEEIEVSDSSRLTFFLDGAHTPESMEVCANWFSNSVKDEQLFIRTRDTHNKPNDKRVVISKYQNSFTIPKQQIIIFNCMRKRDPQILLPKLVDTCARHGVHFSGAFFVPNQLSYNQVGTVLTPPSPDNPDVDLSWQLTLQRTWEKLTSAGKGIKEHRSFHRVPPPHDVFIDHLLEANNSERRNSSFSAVMPSLSSTVRWLKECLHDAKPLHVQVLVTGSLHIVGDMLRLLKKSA